VSTTSFAQLPEEESTIPATNKSVAFFFRQILFLMSRAAVSLSEDLEQSVAWNKIRDTLLGENCRRQDVRGALALAAVCKHPSAGWLTNLFAGHVVNTEEDMREVFLTCRNDARAICFAGVLGGNNVEIRRAADMGDAFAQSIVGWHTAGEEGFEWTRKSAAQGERDGFYWLGRCYEDETACKGDVVKARENYRMASQLGDCEGMKRYAYFFADSDPQKFVFWLGKAAANGTSYSFCAVMRERVRRFDAGVGFANVVFAIGRALKGHIDRENGLIFGDPENFRCINEAERAFLFYEFQLQSYRRAVDSWTIVGLRNGIVKDIRKMIGKMIWESRDEAKHVDCSP
jgi:hypothetical protein